MKLVRGKLKCDNNEKALFLNNVNRLHNITGKSKRGAARDMGISGPHYINVLCGNDGYFTVNTMKTICDYFEVSLKDMTSKEIRTDWYFQDIINEKVLLDYNTLLSVNGTNFRCTCGANIFSKYEHNIFKCNACGLEYKGDEE